MKREKKRTVTNGWVASHILKMIWMGVKAFLVFMGCGCVFYSKFLYPFHMLIVCSILLLFFIYSALVFFYPGKSRIKILSVLTISIVLLSSAYAGFATSRFNSTHMIVPNPEAGDTNFLEQVFKANTFPLYEYLLQKMADIKLRNMEFLVSVPQIQAIKSLLEPGDIILLRKNNYVSNWVIKGFWKHAALYCGSLEEMERYFADASKRVLGSTLKDYLARKNRPAHDELVTRAGLQKGVVIESTSRGVNLEALDKALMSDSLAVLRPRLSRKDKLSAIVYSLAQLKKPYDYYFDFKNDDAFCCSELIYNAFYPHGGTGLTYDLHMVNGRPMVCPNDFAKDFDQAWPSENCQYDFVVYVADGTDPADSREKNIRLFRASWKKKAGI